ncbi:TlpA family protein disulfide reductase [Chitinophaga sp. RAB17]|uniref:TlpA family protein disulfide reductase n=1 Tax=Chitinophaga sp. RAB17 TaxID=3233049 RepID=UPI003F909E34
MIKAILLLFVAVLIVFQPLYAQRRFSVTILLDTAIAAGKVHCSYDNGKQVIDVPDTFVNNKLVLEDNLYSEYAAVSVTYSKEGYRGHSPDFFVGDTAATIWYGFKREVFVYKAYEYAIPINDTTTNHVWRELLASRMKEAIDLSALWTKHNGQEIMGNDSLRHLHEEIQKKMQQKELTVLRKYSHDYYSFWFFKDQIVTPSRIAFEKDTPYLNYLLTFLKMGFPPKFTQSIEGVSLQLLLEGLVRPPEKGGAAPSFSFMDMNGHAYQLSDFKGKYVLLDFWATWCVPCMKSMPFIKELRAKYPADKLIIVGLNYDHDAAKFKNAVKINTMNWLHCFDKDNDIGRVFGEQALPTFILIDKEGTIVYRRSGVGDETEMEKVLERME